MNERKFIVCQFLLKDKDVKINCECYLFERSISEAKERIKFYLRGERFLVEHTKYFVIELEELEEDGQNIAMGNSLQIGINKLSYDIGIARPTKENLLDALAQFETEELNAAYDWLIENHS